MASTTGPVGLMPPPEGVIPDFNVHNRSPTQTQFIIAYSVTLGMASITFLLRLYTRIFVIQSFGADDVLLILAMAASIAFFVCSLDLMQYGFGRHLYEITGAQLQGYLKYCLGMISAYLWAPALTKLSFFVLLHRLNPIKWFRMCLYSLGFIVFAYSFVVNIVVSVPCNPNNTEAGECLNQCGLWQAILSIVTDFLSIILPIRMVIMLKLPATQKAILACVFSTTIFVIIICVVRITYIMSLIENPDVPYSQARAAVWSCVEINIGILCASVIVLKPFVRRHFPSMFSAYSLSGDNSDGRTPSKSFPLGFSDSRTNPGEFKHPNTYHMARVVPGANEDGSGLEQGMSRKDSTSTTSDELHNGIKVTKTIRMNSRTWKDSRRNIETASTEEINGTTTKYSPPS